MWYPYLALGAAFVPLLLMGIGYLLLGRADGAGGSDRGGTRAGDQEKTRS